MTAINADGSDRMPFSPVKAPPSLSGLAAAPYAAGGRGRAGGGSTVVRSVVRKWHREDLLERGGLLLRGLAAVFSFAALVLLASNNHGHGGWRHFDLYQEYRYLLAVAVLAFAYSLAQTWRQANRFRGGDGDFAPGRYSGLVDFVGDQVMAYLLISSLSSTVPITYRMREIIVNNFTNASAASICMAFFTFVVLALSALISGFKVSQQSYI